MKFTPAQLKRFTDRPDAQLRALLVFGADEGLVRERAGVVAKAIVEGAPIVAFATIEHRSPIVVYSSPQKPIRNARDMVGKVIGIAAKGRR